MSESAVPFAAPRLRKRASNVVWVALWVFVVFWFAGIGGAAFLLFSSGKREAGPVAVVAFFGLAGLLIVWLAIRATAKAVRFRGTELQLDARGAVGGSISGLLHVPQRVLRYGGLQFRISSWKRHHEMSDDLLWEAIEPVVRPGIGAAELVTLPFSMKLPFDCEPTAAVEFPRYGYYWKLELQSKKGSVDFEVPVERNEQSSPEQTRDTLRPVIRTVPPDAKTTIDRKLDGVHVALPLPSWVWSWYISITILTIAAFVVAWFVLPRYAAEGMPATFQLGVYGVIGAIGLALLALPLLSLALSVRSVDADRDGITISYALPVRKPVRVPISGLKDVKVEYSNGAMKYSVDFVRADGSSMAGSVILTESREEAEWMAGELRRVLFAAEPAV